ncbi:hypothetical protein DUZ99_03385 [Xylanibacillus composti]|uniref:VOC domain-containing protein n=1 Tax=Xylanibacillus composti TaxID=1572762 RepID=A0A8J4H4N4_9BACL|nr:GyrI-like domain-containing protein [Xylanibacillus composti]MDT9724043.1 hypothetical protein [Xylanibacillus composti]GIQ69436.1 hypothetical protein XYCOK13_22600 [Xylanibacillus composti]
MAPRAEAANVQIRIVWKDAFQVVGEKVQVNPIEAAAPSENAFARLWQRFSERTGEIPHSLPGAYGIHLFGAGCKPGSPCDYLAAVQVSRTDQVPDGMEGAAFPAGLYCVVSRKGVIDEIREAYRFYYDEWLPSSAYTSRPGAEFEYYDERYKGNADPESVMDIWFPIQPKDLPLENRVAAVFVHVSDLRRSAEWYSKLFGLPVLKERLNGGPVYWFDFPGTHLILDADTNNRLDPKWKENMEPLFMLPVRDIDEAYQYLNGKAERLFEPERHGSMAYFNFREPEGKALMACWTAQPSSDPEWTGTSPIRPMIGGVFADVKDLQAAARWYTNLLKLPYDEKMASQSIYAVPVTRGAALLLDHNRHLNGDDFTERFLVETHDIQAALAYVQEQGMRLASELRDVPEMAEFALLDPDGNRIVVAEMK